MGDVAAVEAVGISKRFGGVVALDEVSFRAESGSVTALLGPNGAGKTTVLRILTTLSKPDAGFGRVCGLDVVRNAERVRTLIGVTGQAVALDPALSGRQNLRFVARLCHLGRAVSLRRADELIERLHLEDAADRAIRTYSGGMRRRVDVAVGLLAAPQVLFLDEPTTGLDPASRIEVWDIIRELVTGGASVVLTTQYLEEADQHADHITVIDRGHVVADGTPTELKATLPTSQLDVTLNDPADLDLATNIVSRHSPDPVTVDRRAGRLSVSASGGAATVAAAAHDLAAAGISVAELTLRRPSLDEVFLALTHNQTDGQK
jgi:ABC-2 type transport system ATP-binding protein